LAEEEAAVASNIEERLSFDCICRAHEQPRGPIAFARTILLKYAYIRINIGHGEDGCTWRIEFVKRHCYRMGILKDCIVIKTDYDRTGGQVTSAITLFHEP